LCPTRMVDSKPIHLSYSVRKVLLNPSQLLITE
jgi:hypothetical protein